jgi:phage-related protein
VDTLYGEAADGVRAYAREAAQAGISMNDYSEQAVSFGASLKQAFGGDVTKAAEAANTAILDMADNSAKMGTDITSVQMAYQGFAKQNYTMLDNLKLGYGGTKSEMERLLADAEKLTGVHYDINNLGDVYAAIHAIQGDLGLTGVAAAEASQTFSGSFNAMKASAQNLLGSLALGQNVGPAMTQLAQSVSTFFFGNFIPMIGTLVKSLPTAILAFLQTGLPLLVSGISNLLTSLATNITNFANGN